MGSKVDFRPSLTISNKKILVKSLLGSKIRIYHNGFRIMHQNFFRQFQAQGQVTVAQSFLIVFVPDSSPFDPVLGESKLIRRPKLSLVRIWTRTILGRPISYLGPLIKMKVKVLVITGLQLVI